MPVTKITETFVKSVAFADKGQVLYTDTKLRGFGLLVGKRSKSYVVQRSVKGRPDLGERRRTIGRTDDVPFDEALSTAHTLLGLMAKGIDPKEEEQRQAARTITFKEAWTAYRESLVKQKRAAETIKGYDRLIKYLKDWEDRPLGDITRKEVYDKHRKIAADVAKGKYATIKTKHGEYTKKRNANHGPHTANSAMQLFRTVYNHAAKFYVELPVNPCVALARDWFPTTKRKAVIRTDQLADWWKEVNGLGGVKRDFWRMALFSGLRRGNIIAMRWADVDLERKVAHIPHPKSGRPFDLPLSDLLVDILQTRQEENKKLAVEEKQKQWVFPANSEAGHLVAPEHAFKVAHVAAHDCRRMFITVAESLNLPVFTIKLLCNHAVPGGDVTAGYLQIDTEKLRAPMQRVTDRLRNLTEPKGADSVVPFRGKSKKRKAEG